MILRIWSHLLKKSLMENFIFCAVILEERLIQSSIWLGVKSSALEMSYTKDIRELSWLSNILGYTLKI